MKLHEIRDNAGATKGKIRRGRGPGSGKGKTGGRGIKGQTSRSGVAINAYEGGQNPLYRRLPKRGFKAIAPKDFAIINLHTLQNAVDRGAIAAGATLDEAALVAAGVVRRRLDGVRLLAKGELTVALHLTVAGASKAAVEAVEKAGGKVDIVDVVTIRRAADRAARAETAKA
jgi:large subunit ribosomal protein L15